VTFSTLKKGANPILKQVIVMKKLKIWWMTLFFIIFLGSSIASAHANLISATPKDGQVLNKSPGKISLQFSEQLEPDLIGLKLYDWDGHQIKIDGPKLAPKDPSTMTAKIPSLRQGTYTISWSVVSEDSHLVRGAYFFSVGVAAKEGIKPPLVGDSSTSFIELVLISLRYVTEGLLLLGGGLFWFAWFGKKYGFPTFSQVLGPWRKYSWIVLMAGMVTEGLYYSTTLPGKGLASLLEGNWNVLSQSPFVGMVLAEIILLILVALPSMVESWYLFIWILTVAVLAFGGHAWGAQPIWLALTLRILHVVTISLWLGGLTYLLFTLRWERKMETEISKSNFRSFFSRMAFISATFVVLTGLAMGLMQTNLTALEQSLTIWSTLLFAKIGLVLIMLLIALNQNRRWKKGANSLSNNLLRGELLAGVITILLGVWMSQIAYPSPIRSYAQTFIGSDVQVEVQIPKLQMGKQPMTLRFMGAKQAIPEEVWVQLQQSDTNINSDQIPASKESNGRYAAQIPFMINGKWKFTIMAVYWDGTYHQWEDTVTVGGK
jgi:copper transport protein